MLNKAENVPDYMLCEFAELRTRAAISMGYEGSRSIMQARGWSRDPRTRQAGTRGENRATEHGAGFRSSRFPFRTLCQIFLLPETSLGKTGD